MEFFFSSTLPFVFVVAEGTPPLPPPKPSSSFVTGASPPTTISVSPSSVRVAFSASITCFSFDRESTRKFLFKFPPMRSLALQNLSFPSVQLDAPPRRSESKRVSLAISDPSASSCAFLGTARREMVGFFCDKLLFERSSKAFFSFAFSLRSFFIGRKKVCAKRENAQARTSTFFTFFVSLFFLARKPKKLLFSSAERKEI